MRRAFTLIELLIVIAILLLVASISVSAIGPMLASNHMVEASSKMSGMITLAQAYAQTGSECAILVHRAYRTNEDGLMVDAEGFSTMESGFDGGRAPVWLDHQQARVLVHDGRYGIFVAEDRPPVDLPRGAWVAPDYAVTGAISDLTDLGLTYAPPDGQEFNVLDTFLIVFDQSGQLIEFDSSSTPYQDETQTYLSSGANPEPTFRYPTIPYFSARGLIVYERRKLPTGELGTDVKRREFLTREGRAMFINRFTGSTVQAEIEP